MIVSKLGDSLVVRLSDDDAKKLGLKEGDAVDVTSAQKRRLPLTDPAEREAALERLRRFEGRMPPDFKFNRDEANER